MKTAMLAMLLALAPLAAAAQDDMDELEAMLREMEAESAAPAPTPASVESAQPAQPAQPIQPTPVPAPAAQPSVAAQAAAPLAAAPDKWLNRRYAEPFSLETNSRVENYFFAGFLIGRGDDALSVYAVPSATEEGVYAKKGNTITTNLNSFYFGMMLAKEDAFGLEISSVWQLADDPRANTTVKSPLTFDDYSQNKVALSFRPKYRAYKNEWTWLTLALPLTVNVPVQGALDGQQERDDRLKPDLLDLGVMLLWFVEPADWFTLEAGLSPKLAMQISKRSGGDKYAPGLWTRVYPALRFHHGATMTHYIGVSMEYAHYFYDTKPISADQMEVWFARELTAQRLDLGAGYRFRVAWFEAGLGTSLPLVGDDLPTWGLQGDLRFGF